jgi:thioester reductase-like protein
MSRRSILLTGIGTLGREVVLALMRHSDARLIVLVRDRGRRTATDRATAMFGQLGLTEDERARVEVLRGDVTLPRLGLSETDHARLARDLNVIVHTAAVTSLTADRTLCEAVNCGGTANVLTLALEAYRTGELDRFVHVSTALVAGSGSCGVAREGDLPSSATHTNHYEWSKYTGERLVRRAMAAGLPVAVCRPSMVVGETATGHTRDFNVIYPLMRMMASGYLTQFPAIPASCVHLAPIDFVVDAIMRTISEPWCDGLTFHLTAPHPPTVAELFACDAFFPPSAMRPRLCSPADFDLDACDPRERDLLESVAFAFPYFRSRLSFETTNAQRLVPMPITDAAYLDRLGRYAIDSGYIRHDVHA